MNTIRKLRWRYVAATASNLTLAGLVVLGAAVTR